MESGTNTLIIGLVIGVIVVIALWAWSRSRKPADIPPAKVEEKPVLQPEALAAPSPPAVTPEPLVRARVAEPVVVPAPPPPAPKAKAPAKKATPAEPAAKKPAAKKAAPKTAAPAPKVAAKPAPNAEKPAPKAKAAPKAAAPKKAAAKPAAPPQPPAMLAIGVPGAAGAPDSLLQIKGLGPKLNTLLTGLGITRFDQIAGWGPEEIAKVDEHLGAFKGRIERDSWIEQAGLLARGAIADFEAKFGKLDSEN